MSIIRIAGRVLANSGPAVAGLLTAIYILATGRTWEANYQGRRRVTQPVRAAINWTVATIIVAALQNFMGTLITISAIVATLAVVSFFTRRAARATAERNRQAVRVQVLRTGRELSSAQSNRTRQLAVTR